MPIELRPLDSNRFGVIVGRTTDTTASPEALNIAAAIADVDMLTTRICCSQHSKIHALQADGHQLMDSIVYYTKDILIPLAEQHARRNLRLASPADSGQVASVAQEAFRNYRGHYHADSRLEKAAADAAYADWAYRCVESTNENTPVILHVNNRNIVDGFIALRLNTSHQIEVVLNAVSTKSQRLGHYNSMLTQAFLLGHELGAREIIISTQIDNFHVQGAWIKHGFRPYQCFHTFHKWYNISH